MTHNFTEMTHTHIPTGTQIERTQSVSKWLQINHYRYVILKFNNVKEKENILKFYNKKRQII